MIIDDIKISEVFYVVFPFSHWHQERFLEIWLNDEMCSKFLNREKWIQVFLVTLIMVTFFKAKNCNIFHIHWAVLKCRG